MRSFWPPGEAAQADYEALRAGVLAGAPLAEATAVRFAHGGLAALLAHPTAEPEFVAAVHSAPRPAWTPHADPRLDTLATGYSMLLAAADQLPAAGAVQR